ncbi:hypothetical protein [Comamonas odontotermitis]|uniref:hypothetical protein n=1 Tax=Comamonas odontotermitis TaxID=379895 RepID=UPI001CC5CD39|nr:hypothetical protein [Comamonas odontotermitis]UBB15469.1 hypothetical protein LAD35_11340 [Comamonas odontotermitis]
MNFPYTGWVLMPSFKPVELTFVKDRGGWHRAERGKDYSIHDIFPDKHSAISAGHAALVEQQLAVNKKQANIQKRRAALEKAAGEAKT